MILQRTNHIRASAWKIHYVIIEVETCTDHRVTLMFYFKKARIWILKITISMVISRPESMLS